MSAPLKNLLLSPRLWFCAGMLSLGVGIIVGYHQDQIAAQHALALKGALPAHGIQGLPSSLHVSGLSGVSGPDFTDYSEMRRNFFGISALMVLIGLALLFSLLPSFKRTKNAEVLYEVKAVGAFPSVAPFQPISVQDEKANGPVQRVSSILSATVDTFRAKSRP